MPDIYFSNNPSDWEQLEGEYIAEQKPPGFIQGVSLGTVGMAGQCVRGPLTPQKINSFSRFCEAYGTRDLTADGSGTLMGECWRALVGRQFGPVVIRRVLADDAVTASHTFANVTPTNIIKVWAGANGAKSPGTWGNSLYAAIEDASNGVSTSFNLVITYLGQEYTFENLSVNGSDNNLDLVIGDDLGTLIWVEKLNNGRPLNAGATALTGGTEGTLADADYTAGLEDIAAYNGVAICLVPEAPPTPATVHSSIVTLAAAATDRIFLTWAGVHGNDVADEITDADNITTRSDRIIWCFNSAKVIDPYTSAKMDLAPHIIMASILSQTDVDVHPGAFSNAQYAASVVSLRNEALSRGDLIDLRAAGICALEKLTDGFVFRSGVTTNLQAALTQITRRRMADFIQLSVANRLRYYVKEKNTPEVRAEMVGELIAFCSELKDGQRVVEDFAIEQESVNTAKSRARGLEKLFLKVNLIDHILSLVLMTDISTGTVTEVAA